MTRRVWVLYSPELKKFMHSATCGISWTENINEARIFTRQCDAGNSINYWNYCSYHGKTSKMKKIAVDLELHYDESELNA